MTTVSFKAYLIDNTAEVPHEVRRFGIDADVVKNFLYLREKLQSIFAELRGKRFSINWIDPDGDHITISSDEELEIYLKETKQMVGPLKLYITIYPDSETDKTRKNSGTAHYGIVCDCCEKHLIGFRYKCVQCADYDLCQECEALGMHPEHCMIRIVAPQQWSGYQGRRLMHHLRKFVTKSESHHDKDDDKKEHRKRDKHCDKGKYNSGLSFWLDAIKPCIDEANKLNIPCANPLKETFLNIMNPVIEKHSGAEKPKCDKEKVDFALKYISEHIMELLEGVELDVNFESPEKEKPSTSASADTTKKSEPQAASSTENDISKKFPGEGKKLVDDNKDGASTSKTPPPESSTPQVNIKSQEAEGWTIVTEAESSNISRSSSQSSSSTLGAIPKQVTPSAPSAPSASAVAEATPSKIYPAIPKQEMYHSNPRIQRAVEAMMAMGFSNEGGWLTQLLVSKDGDISKALDVLQPVRS